MPHFGDETVGNVSMPAAENNITVSLSTPVVAQAAYEYWNENGKVTHPVSVFLSIVENDSIVLFRRPKPGFLVNKVTIKTSRFVTNVLNAAFIVSNEEYQPKAHVVVIYQNNEKNKVWTDFIVASKNDDETWSQEIESAETTCGNAKHIAAHSMPYDDTGGESKANFFTQILWSTESDNVSVDIKWKLNSDVIGVVFSLTNDDTPIKCNEGLCALVLDPQKQIVLLCSKYEMRAFILHTTDGTTYTLKSRNEALWKPDTTLDPKLLGKELCPAELISVEAENLANLPTTQEKDDLSNVVASKWGETIKKNEIIKSSETPTIISIARNEDGSYVVLVWGMWPIHVMLDGDENITVQNSKFPLILNDPKFLSVNLKDGENPENKIWGWHQGILTTNIEQHTERFLSTYKTEESDRNNLKMLAMFDMFATNSAKQWLSSCLKTGNGVQVSVLKAVPFCSPNVATEHVLKTKTFMFDKESVFDNIRKTTTEFKRIHGERTSIANEICKELHLIKTKWMVIGFDEFQNTCLKWIADNELSMFTNKNIARVTVSSTKGLTLRNGDIQSVENNPGDARMYELTPMGNIIERARDIFGSSTSSNIEKTVMIKNGHTSNDENFVLLINEQKKFVVSQRSNKDVMRFTSGNLQVENIQWTTINHFDNQDKSLLDDKIHKDFEVSTMSMFNHRDSTEYSTVFFAKYLSSHQQKKGSTLFLTLNPSSSQAKISELSTHENVTCIAAIHRGVVFCYEGTKNPEFTFVKKLSDILKEDDAKTELARNVLKISDDTVDGSDDFNWNTCCVADIIFDKIDSTYVIVVGTSNLEMAVIKFDKVNTRFRLLCVHKPLYDVPDNVANTEIKSVALRQLKNGTYNLGWTVMFETGGDKNIFLDAVQIKNIENEACPGYVGRKFHIERQIQAMRDFASNVEQVVSLQTGAHLTSFHDPNEVNVQNIKGTAWVQVPTLCPNTAVVAQTVWKNCLYYLCYKTYTSPLDRAKISRGSDNLLFNINKIGVNTNKLPPYEDINHDLSDDNVQFVCKFSIDGTKWITTCYVVISQIEGAKTLRLEKDPIDMVFETKKEEKVVVFLYNIRDGDVLQAKTRAIKNETADYTVNIDFEYEAVEYETLTPFLPSAKGISKDSPAIAFLPEKDAAVVPDECLFLLRAWIVSDPTNASASVVRDPSFCKRYALNNDGLANGGFNDGMIVGGMNFTQSGGLWISVFSTDGSGSMKMLELEHKSAPQLSLADIADSIPIDADKKVPILDSGKIRNVWSIVDTLTENAWESPLTEAVRCASARQIEFKINSDWFEHNGNVKFDESPFTASLNFDGGSDTRPNTILAKMLLTFKNETKISLMALATSVDNGESYTLKWFVPSKESLKVDSLKIKRTGENKEAIDIELPTEVSEDDDWYMPQLALCSAVELNNLKDVTNVTFQRFVAPRISDIAARPVTSVSDDLVGGADADAIHWLEGRVQVMNGIGSKGSVAYNAGIDNANYGLKLSDDDISKWIQLDKEKQCFTLCNASSSLESYNSAVKWLELNLYHFVTLKTNSAEVSAETFGVHSWGLNATSKTKTIDKMRDYCRGRLRTIRVYCNHSANLAKCLPPVNVLATVTGIEGGLGSVVQKQDFKLTSVDGVWKLKEKKGNDEMKDFQVKMIILKTRFNAHPCPLRNKNNNQKTIAIKAGADIQTFSDSSFSNDILPINAFVEFGYPPSMCLEADSADEFKLFLFPAESSGIQSPRPRSDESEENSHENLFKMGVGAAYIHEKMLTLSKNDSDQLVIVKLDKIIDCLEETSPEMKRSVFQKATYNSRLEDNVPEGSIVGLRYADNEVAFIVGNLKREPPTGYTLIFDVSKNVTETSNVSTAKKYMAIKIPIDMRFYTDSDHAAYRAISSQETVVFKRVFDTDPEDVLKGVQFTLCGKDSPSIQHTFTPWRDGTTLMFLRENNCEARVLDNRVWGPHCEATTFGLAWAILFSDNENQRVIKPLCPTFTSRLDNKIKSTLSLEELWMASSEDERDILAKKETLELTRNVRYTYTLTGNILKPKIIEASFVNNNRVRTHKGGVIQRNDEPFGHFDNAGSHGLVLIPENGGATEKAIHLSERGATIRTIHKGVSPNKGDTANSVTGILGWVQSQTQKTEYAEINSGEFGRWCADRCAGFFYPDTKLVQTGIRAILFKKQNQQNQPYNAVCKLLKDLDTKFNGVAYVKERGSGGKTPSNEEVFGEETEDKKHFRKKIESFFAVAANANEKLPIVKPVAVVLGGGGVTPTLLNIEGWYTKTQNYERILEIVVNEVKNVTRREEITERMCITAAPIQMGTAAVEQALIQCASLDFGLHFKDRQAVKQSTAQKKTAIFAVARAINKLYPVAESVSTSKRPTPVASSEKRKKFTW